MKVHIKVASWFKRYTDDKTEIELEIAEGAPAFDAACACGIPREEIGFITVISSDGTSMLVKEDYLLAEGDSLKVYPMVIGG